MQNSILFKFEKYLYSRALSGSTVESYISDCNLFANHLKHKQKRLDNFTQEDIRDYFIYKNYSAQSQTRSISALKHLIRFLIINKIRYDDPTHNLLRPKLKEKLPRYLSIKETQKLLNTPNEDTAQGIRDKAILELLFATGMRVSELCSLRFKHYFEEKGYFIVKGKGNKQRIIPISDSANKHLKSYIKVRKKINPFIANQSDYIFISKGLKEKVTRQMVYKIVKKYTTQIKTNKNINPHLLRHTFATATLNHGLNIREVQMLLGHASLSTTKIYATVCDTTLFKVFHEIHSKF